MGITRLARLDRRRGSLSRAVRLARIHYAGHIARRPEGHLLQRVKDLRAPWCKVGRPCYTYSSTLAQDLAAGYDPPPIEGWPALHCCLTGRGSPSTCGRLTSWRQWGGEEESEGEEAELVAASSDDE